MNKPATQDIADPKTAKLSSFKMIGETIINDMPTRYWGLYLLKGLQPPAFSVIKRLHLAGLIAKTILIYIFFLMTMLEHYHIATVAIFTVFVLLSAILDHQERKLIRNSTINALEKYYTEDVLAKRTLYQLCEELSQKLNIPSLVTMITKSAMIGRATFILFYFSIFFITFLKFLIWLIPVLVITKTLYFEFLLGRTKRSAM